MTDDKQVDGRKKHPPMIVWCADAQAGATVLEALRRGFELDLRPRLPKPDKKGHAKGPGVLLLCLSPLETLCRAMAGGTLPSVALKGWQDQAQAIIALNRSNRRKVRILDIDMATRHPEAFLNWFGLPDDAAEIIDARAMDPPSGQDEILRFLAQRTLMGDAATRTLLAELEAVSLNFSKGGALEAGDADIAFQSYQEMRHAQEQTDLLQAQNLAAQQEMEALNKRKIQLEVAQDQAAEKIEQMRQQGEIVQAQNQVMQGELEMLAQGKQQLEQRLEQLGQGMESYQAQMKDLQAQNAGLRIKAGEKDHGLQEAGRMFCDLEMQTAHLMQELNSVNVRLEEKQQQLKEQQQQLRKAEQKLQQFLSSRSYRLVAPLRGLRALMSGRNPV